MKNAVGCADCSRGYNYLEKFERRNTILSLIAQILSALGLLRVPSIKVFKDSRTNELHLHAADSFTGPYSPVNDWCSDFCFDIPLARGKTCRADRKHGRAWDLERTPSCQWRISQPQFESSIEGGDLLPLLEILLEFNSVRDLQTRHKRVASELEKQLTDATNRLFALAEEVTGVVASIEESKAATKSMIGQKTREELEDILKSFFPPEMIEKMREKARNRIRLNVTSRG